MVYDNLSTGAARALIHGEKLVVGDLGDLDRLEAVFDAHPIDTVCHFAASTNVTESVANPLAYYRNNFINTLRLLETSQRRGVRRFIFSSSAAVYGAPASGVATETSPLAPVNPYGSSKLACEWLLRDMAHVHHFNYVVLRYFNVGGADPLARMGQKNGASASLIQICCQAALGLRDGVPIYGTDLPTPDGTAIRDYVHVEDVASAHLAALSHLERGGGPLTLNVGYGTGASVLQVIEAVRKASGNPFPAHPAGRRPGEVASLIAAAGKIREILRWAPKYAGLEQIAADAFRWELSARGKAS